MNARNDVFVFLEPAGDHGAKINQGLLAEGGRIAKQLGGSLSVLLIEESPAALPLEDSGLHKVYSLRARDLTSYCSEKFSFAIASALANIPFGLLLFAHSDRGRELAPRVAFHLHTSAITDCVKVCIRDRALFFSVLRYGGQLEQEISYRDRGRPVVSLSLEALPKRELSESAEIQRIDVPVEIPPGLVGTEICEIIAPDYRSGDITYAQRIVGAGSGCATPELLRLVEELADLLEGSIAATRPMVDDGLFPRDRMVGQTGKTVAPDLYLALGISGSVHHVAGIQQSRAILSVNRDSSVPIFSTADTGFVAELQELLPGLIARIKDYRDDSA